MKKKVILHIGHGKTSTTSIQKTLKQNRSTLLENGFLYPLPDDNYNHNKLFITIFKDEIESLKQLAFIQDINLKSIKHLRQYYSKWFGNKLQKSEASTIIISGEYFPNFTEKELSSVKQYFCKYLGEVDFEILMFTRDPVLYASSAFQQRSRRTRIDSNLCRFSYKTKISRYINVFGRARVNVFKFEDACDCPGGPVFFFLEKIGLSVNLIRQMNICKDNEGMSDLAVDVMIYINTKIPFTEENIKFGLRRRYEHALFSTLPGRKFRLPLDYAKDVMAESKSDMVWLEETFDIGYENRCQDQTDSNLLFGDDYVDRMIVVLRNASPVLKKLIYEYINGRKKDEKLCVDSLRNLEKIELHIINRYPLSVRLSYGALSLPSKVAFPLMEALRKSRSTRWLRARLKERVNSKILGLPGSLK